MSDKIVVTNRLDSPKKQIIQNVLKQEDVEISFLHEFESREKRNKILDDANIMLTLNPANDLKEDEFEHLKNIEFIQLFSAGADHIPYDQIPDSITMASNIGAYADPIAEHVLAMALALSKRLVEEHENMKNGEFNQFNKMNKSIGGSNVAILGFGGIGKAAARLFKTIGAEIYAMNTSGKTNEKVTFIGTKNDLEFILQSADIVVLSLPLNNETRELIGQKELNWMKSDAILINVARGEIINQKELYHHLKANPDFQAGLESWWVEPLRHGEFRLDYPLLDLPNVLASPHNSSMVPGALEYGIKQAAMNVKKYLDGEPFKGEIQRDDFV